MVHTPFTASVDLKTDITTIFNGLATETVVHPGDQLLSSDFGVAKKFILISPGVAAAEGDGHGRVADVTVFQMPGNRLLNQGSDGAEHLFATGHFTAGALGENTLSLTVNGANYWPNGTDNARPLAVGNNTPATIKVIQILPTLEITAGLSQAWVYQNTPTSTADRHRSVLTVNITGGSLAEETYTMGVKENGGPLTDF